MKNVFFRYFPSRLFCLSNFLFWLVLNSVATENAHRTRLFYGQDSNWYLTWVDYLPWWINWAFVTPFIIAAIASIKFDEKHVLIFIGKNLLLLLVTMSVYWSLTLIQAALLHNYGVFDWGVLKGTAEHVLLSPMHFDLLIYLSVTCLGYTLNYYSRNKQQVIHNQQLANQLLRVELESLKSQLSPHFLFNTLNTISGLVRLEQKNDAVHALNELSKMFRKVLENQKNQLTSLKNEMEFIDSYLNIQKMRFENKLVVKIEIDSDCLETELPFMLLHTLVENAVQHGSQLESDENLLHLKIAINNLNLLIELTNKVSINDNHKGFGIGLENCRKRLKHIYFDCYSLECNKTDDGYHKTTLKLPVRIADA
jgi:hypothetical protein